MGALRSWPKVGHRGSLAERFDAKVMPEPNSGCWLWVGAVSEHGYGQIREPGSDGETKLLLAPRAAWTMAHGPIPAGFDVLHKCDTPACVRVDHLFLGTAADNVADMRAKGRGKGQGVTHCAQGHPYSGPNLYVLPRTKRRYCRACLGARTRAYKRRKRGL